MNNKNKIILIFTIVAIALLLFLPIEYSQYINAKGKLLPHKSWVLSKGTDGRLLTSLVDNSTGRNSEFTVTQFERGDAIQFKLNEKILRNTSVLVNDTIGFIISNEIEKDIQKLKGKLETARAFLKVQVSSEKKSIVETEKKKLEFANKQLDEQQKLFERKKKLFERQLVSAQEYEEIEAKYELAKINISIIVEKLRALQSGAKTEEINFAASKISAIEKEIDVLQKRFENNNITSPISGMISRSYSRDTLLIVNDTSKYVVLLPIEWSDSKKIRMNQTVEFSANNISEIGNGEIGIIENSVVNISGREFVVATVLSNTNLTELAPGLMVNCKVSCGTTTALDYFTNIVKTMIN